MCVEKLSTFFLCPQSFKDTKNSDLTNLEQEISRKPNIQAMVWLQLHVFSQIYSANLRQKCEQNFFLKVKFNP